MIEHNSSSGYWGWPDWPKGTLPCSLQLVDIPLVRYQQKAHVEAPERWYWMFHDGEHKWEAKHRYCASEQGSGHYFSLSTSAARSELKAYGKSEDDHLPVTLLINADNLLDLTKLGPITWFLREHMKVDTNRVPWFYLVDSLLDQARGGDNFNAFIGAKALKLGYTGLVALGANSGEHWPNPGSMIVGRALDDRDPDLLGLHFESLRLDGSCVIVVMFFGHNVIRHTKKVWIRGQQVFENPFYQEEMRNIDKLFMNDKERPISLNLEYESLVERAQRSLWTAPPGFQFLDDQGQD